MKYLKSNSNLTPTRMHLLKLTHIQLLIHKPNPKINTIGRRQIDFDLINPQPKKELLHLNPIQIANGPVLQLPSYLLLVVNGVIEMDVTCLFELNDEAAVIGEGVGFDVGRQEAGGEAEFGEDFVDGGWVLMTVGGGGGECEDY